MATLDTTNTYPAGDKPAPTQLIAGALVHLATHLETACPRAAHRARLLLAELAACRGSCEALREPAVALSELLDRDHDPARCTAGARQRSAAGAPGAGR